MLVDQACRLCVGVPVYNEIMYLPRMLDSLKAQNLCDVKYLICDNHSTDGGWDFILNQCESDDRFVLYRHSENIGASKNFEFLFRNSTSEYFMWMGAHDYISSNLLEKSVKHLEENTDISLVAGRPFRFFDDLVPDFMPEAIYSFSSNRLERYFQSVELLKNCTIFNSVFRRNGLANLEFKHTRGWDHVILSRLLWHGGIGYLEDESYFRRYFESVRAMDYSQRITGGKNVLGMHDLILYYLDDLNKLYEGDSRMLRYLEGRVIDILVNRYTLQTLSREDDAEYWKSRC